MGIGSISAARAAVQRVAVHRLPGEPICTTSYITISDGYTGGRHVAGDQRDVALPPERLHGPASRNAYYAGNLVEAPPPGVVKVTANFKVQNIKFWANENDDPTGSPGAVPIMRYFVRDPWGDVYVMHTSGQDTPRGVTQGFDDAVLPQGWTKSKHPLRKDLVLRPAEGSDGSFHYLIIRASADNTYHQFKWSDRGALQAHVQGSAMPVWGGQDDNVLAGGRRADLIHGAGGNDKLRPGRQRRSVGDAGFDTVVLAGNSRRYRLRWRSRRNRKIVVAGRGSKKTIRYAERLEFSNETVRIGILRRHDVVKRL